MRQRGNAPGPLDVRHGWPGRADTAGRGDGPTWGPRAHHLRRQAMKSVASQCDLIRESLLSANHFGLFGPSRLASTRYYMSVSLPGYHSRQKFSPSATRSGRQSIRRSAHSLHDITPPIVTAVPQRFPTLHYLRSTRSIYPHPTPKSLQYSEFQSRHAPEILHGTLAQGVQDWSGRAARARNPGRRQRPRPGCEVVDDGATVLTISRLSRWSIGYYNETAEQARQSAMDRQRANGGLGEYYSEGDTRMPTWVVVGDTAAVGERTGLDGAALDGGFADTENAARWLDDGIPRTGLRGGLSPGQRARFRPDFRRSQKRVAAAGADRW